MSNLYFCSWLLELDKYCPLLSCVCRERRDFKVYLDQMDQMDLWDLKDLRYNVWIFPLFIIYTHKSL